MKQIISAGGWRIIREALDNMNTPQSRHAGSYAHAQMRKYSHAEQRASFKAHGMSTYHCDNGSCGYCKNAKKA